MFKDTDVDDFDELRLDGPSNSSVSAVKSIPRTTIKKESNDSPLAAAQRRNPRRAAILRSEINANSKEPTLLTPSRQQTILSQNRSIKRESQTSTPLLDLTPSRTKTISKNAQEVSGSTEQRSSPIVVLKSEEDSEDEDYGKATASSSLFPELITSTRKQKPSNKFLDSPKTYNVDVSIRTSSGAQVRKCGDKGFRCEKFICFKCLPKDAATSEC